MVTIGSLFSGYGGLDIAARRVFGGDLVWHCENDAAAARVLAHHWPDVPNLGDITAVQWDDVPPVDILTGGPPCQDVSLAGKRAGLRSGTRSGLWACMADAVEHVRPPMVIIENVRGLLSARADSDVEPCPWCLGDNDSSGLRALGAVLGDLASIGYDARWDCVRAADVGAPHNRHRVFVIAVAQDTHRAVSDERRVTASGQAQGGRSRADTGGRDRAPVADPARHRWQQGRTEPTRQDRGPNAALGAAPVADTNSGGPRPQLHLGAEQSELHPPRRNDAQRCSADTDWGSYTSAIQRWETVLGRSAPAPTCVGRRGARVLDPLFVEWLMGLDHGHVTNVDGLSRISVLRLLGNGVVPQQAEHAIRLLTPALQEVA